MSWNNKVIWSEGLFVRTQHFQQHDRYVEGLVEARCGSLQPFSWGISQLEIDKNLLTLGKFAVSSCSGIMPDGSPFNIPDDTPTPPPLEVSEKVTNETVYLALPLHRKGQTEIDTQQGMDALARYVPEEFETNDNIAGRNKSAKIQVGKLRLRLMLEHEPRSEYACLGLAKIREASPEKGIILDDSYLPSCLHCTASTKITNFLTELQGLLKHRCDALAGRVSDAGRGGVSEIADFLMLQLVNRYEPLVAHLIQITELHPEALFRICTQMAGELSTFTRQEKRPVEIPAYRHDDLQVAFDPLMKELRRSLTMVLEQNAISVPWEEHKYGVRIAHVSDRSLFKTAHFVIAVNADVPPETLQSSFPSQVKIGPVEYIRQLVNSGLPGISLRVLPAVPRQIPYHAGFTYFELDRTSRYWEGLEQSGAFALHVAGDFPGLKLELWAIKD